MQSISQVLQNLKLCASLHVAKAPMLFSLLSKDYDPGFLLKMVLPPFCHSHSPGEQHRKSRGRWPDSLLTPEGGALWTIWRSSGLITGETEQNCEADGREQKAILVWGEIWSLQLHKQMLLLDWHVDPTPAGTGTVCRWGRHTVHTLSAESGRNWVKKGKGAGRQVSQPDCISVQISRERNLHFTSF